MLREPEEGHQRAPEVSSSSLVANVYANLQ